MVSDVTPVKASWTIKVRINFNDDSPGCRKFADTYVWLDDTFADRVVSMRNMSIIVTVFEPSSVNLIIDHLMTTYENESFNFDVYCVG